MNPPPTYPDGACTGCVGHFGPCAYHRAQEKIREETARENLRRAVEGMHRRELESICLRYELESDEGGTRWEKAERIHRQRKAA